MKIVLETVTFKRLTWDNMIELDTAVRDLALVGTNNEQVCIPLWVWPKTTLFLMHLGCQKYNLSKKAQRELTKLHTLLAPQHSREVGPVRTLFTVPNFRREEWKAILRDVLTKPDAFKRLSFDDWARKVMKDNYDGKTPGLSEA